MVVGNRSLFLVRHKVSRELTRVYGVIADSYGDSFFLVWAAGTAARSCSKEPAFVWLLANDFTPVEEQFMPAPTYIDLIEKPTVVNVRYAPCDCYIGRPFYHRPGSKWANPFRITPSRDRIQAIAAYRHYITHERPDLLSALHELTGKSLGCWCAPLPCHGDVLVELWEQYVAPTLRGHDA